jgi:hypothetical protein
MAHHILKNYTHTEIARAFQDDTNLADFGVEDTFKECDEVEGTMRML